MLVRTARIGLVVVAAMVMCACSARVAVAPGDVRARGEREIAALLKRVAVYGDPGVNEYVAGVARRVGGGDVAVTVLADPTLAAFAMPGRVFVHTGLLSLVEDEAELAAVLARELAHDPSRLVAHSEKPPMSTVALGPTAAALWGLDLRLALGAALDGYGRDEERDADVAAMRRLAPAGYDPRAPARLYARLAGPPADRAGLAEVFTYGGPGRMREREEVARSLSAGTPPTQPMDGGELARRLRALVRDNAALDVRAGRWALAARQLDRALALDPSDAVAHLVYGELDRLRAQRASGGEAAESARRAAARFDKALELDPRSAAPLRQLALLHYQQGDVGAARAAFARYLAAEPGAPDGPRIRGYLAILGR